MKARQLNWPNPSTSRSSSRWMCAGHLMVVRMVDGAKPLPPQKMSTERFLEREAKKKSQAREVISVYEK